MSEILKAKNRILNRNKIAINVPQNQQDHQGQSLYRVNSQIHEFNEQTFDLEPVTSANQSKKFNISSISMKFAKNQDKQQQQYDSRRYQNVKLQLSPNKQSKSQQKARQKSPQFSRTQRINPIRHFEPYNINTLSESNSQASLAKWSKDKNRRTSMQSRVHQNSTEQFQKKSSEVRTTFQNRLNQSPINKIKKKVHNQPLNLLIARQQPRRAQSPYKPRQCIKQWTQSFICSVQQNRKPFNDQTFPAHLTSFFSKKSLYSSEPGLSFEHLSKSYQNLDVEQVLIKSCQPTLLNPGKYTNPYLYSALKILAQYPERVLGLFQNQAINQKGVYFVKLCRDGTWRYIIVDDFMPVKVQQGKSSRNNEFLGISSIDANGIAEIWPSLIQKALAKIYGTYYDLSMSRRDGVCPIFRALTGFPVSKYDLIKDVRSYLVLIDSALKKNHIIVLQQILPQFEYLAELKSISVMESYQILQIQKNSFILRNLSDFDLVTKLTFDEVMMFSSLLIFRKQDSYNYVSQKLRHKQSYYSTVKVNVPQNTLCYFDVWQNNPAYYKNHFQNRIQYEVCPYKLLIQPISIESSSNQFDSIPQAETIVESGKQVSLKKGEYLVQIHLCQSLQQMDYTLSYYGEKDVSIQRIKNQKQRWNQKCCGNN